MAGYVIRVTVKGSVAVLSPFPDDDSRRDLRAVSCHVLYLNRIVLGLVLAVSL